MSRQSVRAVPALAALALALAALGLGACGQAPDPAHAAPIPAPAPVPAGLPEATRAAIRDVARAELERQELVALSLAFARAGGVVHTEHLGLEDRARAIPASDATLYRWASISKPLTAIAALQLHDAGRLDLDADVRELVPEFPAKPHPITARQLLCHQGGIVHYTNGEVVASPPRTDVAHPHEDAVDALDRFELSPLVCEPGTRYAYTTHGYVLLGAVVQRAGGAPYEQQVRERIARPLGMSTLRADKAWIDMPHRAAGYQRVLGAIVPSLETDVSWKLAGGGFLSSAPDLARFGGGLLAGELVSPAARERMWTDQPTRAGEPTGYGLGFRVGAHRGRRLVSHGGSQEKTRTLLLVLPDDDLAVALMTNCEWARLPPLGDALLDALLAAPGATAADAGVAASAAQPVTSGAAGR